MEGWSGLSELSVISWVSTFTLRSSFTSPGATCIFLRFLLGTGRMPHPVGGAMGVTCHCLEKGISRFDIISLNIHKTTSRWYCMAVVLRPRLLTFACLAWHPANCFTALPKVFSGDLPVCQCIRTHLLV